MRKNYTLLLLMFFGGLFAMAQNNQVPATNNVENPYHFKKNVPVLKTVNCVDSVRYPQSKLSGLPETGPLTNNTAAQTGISQAFHLSSPASIHGIGAYLLLDFDGVPGNFAPVTAKIKVYNIDGQNYPTTPIDSAMTQVVDAGFNEQVLMFSSPISVSDSFAIAIEMGTFNATTDTIWYTTNVCGWNGSICAVGDGDNEDLSCVLSPDFTSANGSNWFNNNIEVFGWNIDFLMHPIVETVVTASYTTDTDTICLGDSVMFTNTSTINTDGMFNTFNTTTKHLHQWDFKDGTGTYNVTDTTYSWAAAGTYNVDLITTYFGYSLNCIDVASQNITVHDTAIANYGWMELLAPTIQFSDSSLNALTYFWNFGDGDTSTAQNPSHIYTAPGAYYVCLTVTDTNGCNQNMFCDSISFTVGLPEVVASNQISVYPVPARKYFNVSVPDQYLGGEIVVTDVVGKKLKVIAIDNQEKVKVLTNEISSGIYFVSVDYLGERVYTQRIVIDK